MSLKIFGTVKLAQVQHKHFYCHISFGYDVVIDYFSILEDLSLTYITNYFINPYPGYSTDRISTEKSIDMHCKKLTVDFRSYDTPWKNTMRF